MLFRSDYFCVPFSEFKRAAPESVNLHIPRKEYYPTLEEFRYTNHEYYRYHNAYLKSYNEQDVVRIFADAALAYDEEEMGAFTASFRCSDGALANHIQGILSTKGKVFEIARKASVLAAKTDKKAAKLLETQSISSLCNDRTGTVMYIFKQPEPKAKGKAKKK